MKRSLKRGSAITTWCVVAMVAGAVLSGCSSQEASPKVERTAIPTDAATTETPTADPTKSPTAPSDPGNAGSDASAATADFTFPACDELISDTRAQELSGDDRYVAIADTSGMSIFAFEHAFGPVAGEAFSSADISEHCVWGLPNSGLSDQVFIAVLDDAERAALEAAFDEAFGGASHIGDAVLYEHHTEEGVSPLYRDFWFTGDVWVSHFSSGEASQFGKEALGAAVEAYSVAVTSAATTSDTSATTATE